MISMGSRISLCMIVKDEARNLRRCLESVVGAVDEIIVVDTGSSDDTYKIAGQYGARVYSFPWNENFSDARNASLETATGDWILFLDADEELAPESKEVLRRITADDTVEGYFIKIINYIGNEGCFEPSPDIIFRLFRNRREYRFRGAIHEQIADVILEKNSRAKYQIAEDMVILHYGYLNQQIEAKDKKSRNLAIIERELAGAPDNRLLRYHYGVELYRAERYKEAAAELFKAAEGLDSQTVYLPKLLRYIVLSYHSAQMPEEALDVVRLGLSLFPNYADLYYYGGVVSFEKKDYAQAYDFFQGALAMPEQPAYYAPFSGMRGFRCYYQLGRLAEVFGNEQEAMRYYVLSLRDNPSFVIPLESITRLLEPHQDPVYAQTCLEKLCDFSVPDASLLIGQILFRESAYELALDYIERAMAQREVAAEVKLWKVICLIQLRRYFEALKILDSFGPDHRLYPLAKLNKIFCFWIQGNRRKVRPLVEELFALGLSAETGAVVGLLRDSLGRYRFAKVTLGDEGMSLLLDIVARTLHLREKQRAAALLAGLSEECLARNAQAVGRLFYRYGFLEEAEDYFFIDLKNNRESVETLSKLAEIKQKQGAYIRAADLYRQVIAIEPGEPRHYVKLIKLYEEMRREILKTASEQYPGVPVFRELLEEAERAT